MIIGFFIITFINLINADPIPLNYKYISFNDDKYDVHEYIMLGICKQHVSGNYNKYTSYNTTHAIRTYHKSDDINCSGESINTEYYEVKYYNEDSFIYNYELCKFNYLNSECRNDPYAILCFDKEGCNKYDDNNSFYIKYQPINNTIYGGQWRNEECKPIDSNYINGKCYSGMILEYIGRNGTFPILTILFIIVIHFLL